jgi:hypothetical protein
MPKQVRLRRGTTAQHTTFTGADGEVTFDTTKKALVLHDGVTPGGKPLEGFLVLDPGSPMLQQVINTCVIIAGGDGDSDSLRVNLRSQFNGPVAMDDYLAARRLIIQQETVTYAASLALNFNSYGVKRISLTGNLSLSVVNQLNNQNLLVRLDADASTRTLTFPAGWRWVGSAAPANLAANKVALLRLWSFGTEETDVVAKWEVES